MNHSEIQIRDARKDDASFIARVVLAGIDMLDLGETLPKEQMPIFEHLVDICRMDDTLYSWCHTRIADVEGEAAGALVAYDGEHYAVMREKTFGLVQQNSGMDLSKNAMETGVGELYLDSMAIKPEFRGREIGHLLMRDRMDYAFNSGFQSVSLLVDKDKPHLRQYYASLGFEFCEEMFVFGAWYDKLTCHMK